MSGVRSVRRAEANYPNHEPNPESVKNKNIESTSASLSGLDAFNAEERETCILIDHFVGEVHFETTHPATARRWLEVVIDIPDVIFEAHRDSFAFRLPIKCVRRRTELIVRPKYRQQTKNSVVMPDKATLRSGGDV